MPPRIVPKRAVKNKKFLKRSDNVMALFYDATYHQDSINDNDAELYSQQIKMYVNSNQKLYIAFLEFLEDINYSDVDFQNIINIINKQRYEKRKEEFKHFLFMVHYISNNHHANELFFQKIFDIILHYKVQIIQTFSNIEIYSIFKRNKKILLFLFENKIIKIDNNIYHSIINTTINNGNSYCNFFYPEIKEFANDEKTKEIEANLLSNDENIFDNFNENRHKGQNNSYICTLIRQDLVELFIEYVNRRNIPLNSTIIPSFFETNSFLNNKNPTLIEYSAFFGSIQIFQYLLMNNVELTPSLWLYSIHSKNAELIHLLEYNEVVPPKKNYNICFIESIKCHHNDIAEYIKNNLVKKQIINSSIISSILQYHNYANFPNNFSNNAVFFYLCKYKYTKIVDLLVESKKKCLEELLKKQQFTIKIRFNTIDKNLRFYYLMLTQKNLAKCTFKENYVMSKIAIPPIITCINDYAFSEYKFLSHISIPSSVTSIGNNAFSKCVSLEHVLIPSSVTSIGNYAFLECSSLKHVKFAIPSSLTSIGDFSFKGCLKLEQILIPPSVTSIGKGSFIDCKKLDNLGFFNGFYDNKLLIIKSAANEIYDSLIWCKNNVKEVIVPQIVKTIDNSAFCECTLLTQITIPSSVTSIKKDAFKGCFSLKQISFETDSFLTSLDDNAFYGCSRLTRISLPSSITYIGKNAFKSCSSLLQIIIPSSVTSIGNNAFDSCSFLENVSFVTPSALTTIGSYVFSKCYKLTQISIPSSVTSIGYYAFNNCISLKQVIFSIQSPLKLIGSSTFRKCFSLEHISIPSSVTSIRSSAFYECESLKQITIPPSVTSIGSFAFACCISLKQILIPSSVTSIGDNAFYECRLLEKITIPSFTNKNCLGIPFTSDVVTIK